MPNSYSHSSFSTKTQETALSPYWILRLRAPSLCHFFFYFFRDKEIWYVVGSEWIAFFIIFNTWNLVSLFRQNADQFYFFCWKILSGCNRIASIISLILGVVNHIHCHQSMGWFMVCSDINASILFLCFDMVKVCKRLLCPLFQRNKLWQCNVYIIIVIFITFFEIFHKKL